MAHAEAVSKDLWPALPYEEWVDTCDTLHMWTQIAGKTRLELTPLVNHWWNVPLYLTERGLTTSAMPYGRLALEVEFDFIAHRVLITTSEGTERIMQLYPRSVADFYAEYMSLLRELGFEIRIWTMPVEFHDPIPFELDRKHASYDKEYANRFWRVLLQADRVLKEFRARFIGKSSPVHFFWGSFDLAVTRFSGRPAPVRPDLDRVTREAYSHEVISCGFWPGDPRSKMPAFYAYAAPTPEGLGKEPVRPAQAFWSNELGEFLLNYDDVRSAESPDAAILDFAQSTYEAGARLAKWDRSALERAA